MKQHTAIVLLIMVALVVDAGCISFHPPYEGPAGSESPKQNVMIQPDINRYTLAMSQAPGVGLSPVFYGVNPPGNITYIWKTDYGYFVDWSAPDFTVKELGANATVTSKKVYWTFFGVSSDNTRPPVHITLDVVDAATGAEIAHAERIIGWIEGNIAEIR